MVVINGMNVVCICHMYTYVCDTHMYNVKKKGLHMYIVVDLGTKHTCTRQQTNNGKLIEGRGSFVLCLSTCTSNLTSTTTSYGTGLVDSLVDPIIHM